MHCRLAESDSAVVMDIAERKAFRDYGSDVRTVASEPQKDADSAGGGGHWQTFHHMPVAFFLTDSAAISSNSLAGHIDPLRCSQFQLICSDDSQVLQLCGRSVADHAVRVLTSPLDRLARTTPTSSTRQKQQLI